MTAENPVFTGVQVVSDLSPAQWIAGQLAPQPANRAVRVRSLVPDVYPSYGRLLHHARSAIPDEADHIRWSSIAAKNGTTIDSGARFRDLVGWHDGPAPPWPYDAPLRGTLDEDECLALAEILTAYTKTPQTIWYCLWDGLGWPELPPPRQGPPRVRIGHEDYLLFTGPLSASTNFRSVAWFQSPSIWWPSDRAWCVSTPTDGFSTYIGGSEPCVNALVDHPRLEILPIQVDQSVDSSPFPA
jgi:hypothetical protein